MFIFQPGQLTQKDLYNCTFNPQPIAINKENIELINQSFSFVQSLIQSEKKYMV